MMNEVLQYVQDLWNNSVAFANTTGVTTLLVAVGYMYINHKLKKKDNTIKVEVGDNNQKVDGLKTEVEASKKEVAKTNEKLDRLTELLFTFANSTKISDATKKDLAKIFSSIETGNYKEVVETIKDKATDVFEDVVETVKEEKESVIDKLRKEINE